MSARPARRAALGAALALGALGLAACEPMAPVAMVPPPGAPVQVASAAPAAAPRPVQTRPPVPISSVPIVEPAGTDTRTSGTVLPQFAVEGAAASPSDVPAPDLPRP